MRKTSVRLMLAGALALSATAPGFARSWHSDDTAALVGGLVLGGIVAAASSHDHRHRNQYVPPPPPYQPRMAPFSPARGVTCYPREGACYDNDGDFLPSWTNRVF
jgi:hypothetical protein